MYFERIYERFKRNICIIYTYRYKEEQRGYIKRN